MLGFKLNHVSKRGHSRHWIDCVHVVYTPDPIPCHRSRKHNLQQRRKWPLSTPFSTKYTHIVMYKYTINGIDNLCIFWCEALVTVTAGIWLWLFRETAIVGVWRQLILSKLSGVGRRGWRGASLPTNLHVLVTNWHPSWSIVTVSPRLCWSLCAERLQVKYLLDIYKSKGYDFFVKADFNKHMKYWFHSSPLWSVVVMMWW